MLIHPNLVSPGRQAFFRCIRSTYPLPPTTLVAIIQNGGQYSPRYRSAALRTLVGQAPIEVTHGLCYTHRRRLVRQHYGV